MRITEIAKCLSEGRWNEIRKSALSPPWKCIPTTVNLVAQIAQNFKATGKSSDIERKVLKEVSSSIHLIPLDRFCEVAHYYQEAVRRTEILFAPLIFLCDEGDTKKSIRIFEGLVESAISCIKKNLAVEEPETDEFKKPLVKIGLLMVMYEEIIMSYFNKDMAWVNFLRAVAGGNTRAAKVFSDLIAFELYLKFQVQLRGVEPDDLHDRGYWDEIRGKSVAFYGILTTEGEHVSLPIPVEMIEEVAGVTTLFTDQLKDQSSRHSKLLRYFDTDFKLFMEKQDEMWSEIRSGSIYSLRGGGRDLIEIDIPDLGCGLMSVKSMVIEPVSHPICQVRMAVELIGRPMEICFSIMPGKYQSSSNTLTENWQERTCSRVLYHLAVVGLWVLRKRPDKINKPKNSGSGKSGKVEWKNAYIPPMLRRLPKGQSSSLRAKDNWSQDPARPEWIEGYTYVVGYERCPDLPDNNEPLFTIGEEAGIFE